MRAYGTNAGEQITASEAVGRRCLEISGNEIYRRGVIVGTWHGGLAIRWDTESELFMVADGNIVILEREVTLEDLRDLITELPDFNELLRQLGEERGYLETAVHHAHHAADEIRRAAKGANEAAGWISNEVSRMRRC